MTMNAEQLHPDFWLNWETLSNVGEPTLLGSVILGAPTAGLFYFLTKRAVLKTQRGMDRTKSLTRATPPPREPGRDGFHSVPDFARPARRDIRDSVERVPTWFKGAKREL